VRLVVAASRWQPSGVRLQPGQAAEYGPDGGGQSAHAVRLRSEREHVGVLSAGIVDVRELADEQSEVHGSSFDKY
jgi:hypothetical protein